MMASWAHKRIAIFFSGGVQFFGRSRILNLDPLQDLAGRPVKTGTPSEPVSIPKPAELLDDLWHFGPPLQLPLCENRDGRVESIAGRVQTRQRRHIALRRG